VDTVNGEAIIFVKTLSDGMKHLRGQTKMIYLADPLKILNPKKTLGVL